MKKSLISFAVLGAFAGSAAAQTNVTIYGVVDAGITWEDNGGAAGSVTRLDSGLMNGSRLGFRGTEELGGGLSAMFQIENGFATDTGALGQGGRLFGRQAWVGLGGGFGTVRLGRQMTPVYANNATFDPFENALAGDSARLFNYSGSRTDNVISYTYDSRGIRAQLQYGFGEVPGDSSANRTIGGYVGYRGGPIDTVLAHTSTDNATGAIRGKTTLLGGNYNFGVARVYAAYAWNKDVVTPTGTIAAGADTHNGLLGVAVPLGAAGLVRASYVKVWDKARGSADADQIALGYTHALSKRTSLYTSVSRTSNDSGANYGGAATPGATDKLFDVGVRHSF